MFVRDPPRCQSTIPSLAGSGIQQSSAEFNQVEDGDRGIEGLRSKRVSPYLTVSLTW
jgi:hypothetical protein